MNLSLADLAARTDCALWKPAATQSDVQALCAAAIRHKFRAVCVNGSRVELARSQLEDSAVKIVALAGFPLGAMDADAKRFETEVAVDHGAHEIEVVLNAGLLRDGDAKSILRELRDVAEAADERPVCVALELSLLTREQAILGCHLALDSGATCVSTSTDFWPGTRVSSEDAKSLTGRVAVELGIYAGTRVSPDEVKLLREAVGPKFGVKAAGGIQDFSSAPALIEAGATRLGFCLLANTMTGKSSFG